MTQIRYPGQESLNGRQRGYKQAGKRLLPRDAYDAAEIAHYKLHGLKGLQAARIKEANAYTCDEERTAYARHKGDFNPFDVAECKLKALSARKRRLAENACYGNGTSARLPRSIRRVVEAMDQAQRIDACMDHDRRMLSNCR